jgi:hypothetical protein
MGSMERKPHQFPGFCERNPHRAPGSWERKPYPVPGSSEGKPNWEPCCKLLITKGLGRIPGS